MFGYAIVRLRFANRTYNSLLLRAIPVISKSAAALKPDRQQKQNTLIYHVFQPHPSGGLVWFLMTRFIQICFDIHPNTSLQAEQYLHIDDIAKDYQCLLDL